MSEKLGLFEEKSTPDKLTQFKRILIPAVKKLQNQGIKDRKAMWMLGRYASRFMDETKAKSWPEFRARLTREGYDALLNSFQNKGNALHKAGKTEAAYAVEILGLSVITKLFGQDEVVAAGAAYLDEIIAKTVTLYRQQELKGAGNAPLSPKPTPVG